MTSLDELLFGHGPPLTLFLGGSAIRWFGRMLSSQPFHSFVDFQQRLLEEIYGSDWRSQLDRSIERRTERKETIDDYAEGLRQLIFVAYLDYPRSEREEKLANTFACGLKDPIERMQCLSQLKANPRVTIEYLLSLVRQYRSTCSHSSALTVAAMPLTADLPRRSKDPPPERRVNRCHRCNSTDHYVKDCPYEVVLRKSLLENDLVLTRHPEEEKKLPSGTKFVRALSFDPTEEDKEPESEETDMEQLYVRALAAIQNHDKSYWIKREIRIEIKLPWVEHPLLALFDFGAEVTVISSEFADGAEMLAETPPTVRDASNNVMPFLGVSREHLEMGNHTFPTMVVWADLAIDAILGMDVIGPWMLTPRWSRSVFVSERDPSIVIPFVRSDGPSLGAYKLSLCPEDQQGDEEEDRMFGFENTVPLPVNLDSLVAPDMSAEEHNILLAPLRKNIILCEGGDARCNVSQHVIRTITSRPIRSSPRRVNPQRLALIQKQVDDLGPRNIISPTSSPYASPVTLADRKDGPDGPREPRFCVDYRRINAVTIKDQYSLPAADDLFHCLNGFSYFAAFDLRSGFWQIEVEPESRKYTAFVYPGGMHEFNVMPFGLCNAPATFQRVMDIVLGPLKYTAALVFLDDILVMGRTVHELAENCGKVFERLVAANLRFNTKKIRIGFRELTYLGHVINNLGISPDPEKVQGIRDFPRPTNFAEVRSFNGMVSYYRKFIPNLTNHSRPLETLCSSKSWQWTEVEERAFQNCKGILSREALLHYPNYNLPFMIQTDASSVGLGAVLLQVEDGVEKPIYYASRALTSNESKYHARELECLAVKWALRRFRPTIEGYPVTVITDHESLIWLMRQEVPSGRLARWVLELQGTDFSVAHRNGDQNRNVDALSRAVPVQTLCSLSLSEPHANTEWKERLIQAQSSDDHCKSLWLKGESEKDDYSISEGVLCRKVRVRWQEWLVAVIPESLRSEILRAYHSDPRAGHFGVQHTFEIMRRRFTWQRMRADIKDWIRRCSVCSKEKPVTGKKPGPMGIIQPEHWNQVLCLDHVGPINSHRRRWILVMMDAASRWPEVVITTSLSSKVTARHVRNSWFYRYGAPEALLTDNGTAFQGVPFRKLTSDWNVVHHRTSPYHPQANPVERLHADLKRLIRTAMEELGTLNWEDQVQLSAFCLRNKIHSSLKISPSELVLGTAMRMPLDVVRNPNSEEPDWEAAKANDRVARESRKSNYDRTRVEVTFKPGDQVLIKRPVVTSVWDSPFVGPYRVVKRLTPDAYLLAHNNSGHTLRRHVSDLKPTWAIDQKGEMM